MASIQRQLSSLFEYKDQFRQDNADSLKILLPATPAGEPDWKYMEMYMRGVEAIAKEKIALLTKKKQEPVQQTSITNYGTVNIYEKVIVPPLACAFIFFTIMVNNINNFGVINFYESNSANSHSESKQVEDIRPLSSSVSSELDSDITTRKESPQEKPYTPPVPREGDYNGVRLYIEERKRYDDSFKDYCSHHNRKELCILLTKEFGWFVDDKSLGKNISRNI